MTEPAPPIVTKDQLIFELGKLGLKVHKIDVYNSIGMIRVVLFAGDMPETPEGWLEAGPRREAIERAMSLTSRLPMGNELDVYFAQKGDSELLR
jgi:hypothetical protein